MAQPERLVLRSGEEETILLPGRGTVGYEWEVSVSDSDVVTVRETAPRTARSGPPGESPPHAFVVAAARPGRTVVVFEQRRPWESETEPLERREFEVVVES